MGSYQARVASFLWAVALVVSFNSSSAWLVDLRSCWSSLVALAAALALLVRPESLWLLRLSIVTYLVSACAIMPNIPNHRMVLLFAGVALLIESFNRSASSRASTNLRWLTVAVYLFAGLAKCNEHYLRADTSCASLFFLESLQLHGVIPFDATGYRAGVSWVGWWSLFAEILLVLLLIPNRTRAVGIIGGIAFHLFLATHYIKYFANFSAAMFLLLCSWLSEEQCKQLVTRYLAKRNGVFLLGALVFCLSLGAHAYGLIGSGMWLVLRYVIWSVFGVFMLVAVTQTVRAEPSIEGRSSLTAPSFVLIGLALLNGFSPYLGIKTRSGFSMYSNLRIEPGYSNHLFMPASGDLFGYLSDTVRISSSTDQALIELTGQPSEALPYILLCAYLAKMDGGPQALQSEVTYERNGELSTRTRGEQLPNDCPAWFARKLLLHGPVGDGAERHCIW